VSISVAMATRYVSRTHHNLDSDPRKKNRNSVRV
jgi:hypothetical protein